MADATPQPDDRAPDQTPANEHASDAHDAQKVPNESANAPSADAASIESSEAAPQHPEQMASEAIDNVQQAAGRLAEEATGTENASTDDQNRSSVSSQSMPLPDLNGELASNESNDAAISLLGDVALRVEVELGRTRMYIEDVLRLNEQSIIELDKAAGDPVDIYVNDRHIARGEVLVVNDNFCVRISELVNADRADDETLNSEE